jgi:hypothetical protein
MIRRNVERSLRARVVPLCLLIAMLCILCVRAASSTAIVSLMVQVRPEARLDQAGMLLRVEIRLAPRAEARLWWATACGAPTPGALVITRSGTYAIPISALGAAEGGSICLASSDGTLRLAQPRQM